MLSIGKHSADSRIKPRVTEDAILSTERKAKKKVKIKHDEMWTLHAMACLLSKTYPKEAIALGLGGGGCIKD